MAGTYSSSSIFKCTNSSVSSGISFWASVESISNVLPNRFQVYDAACSFSSKYLSKISLIVSSRPTYIYIHIYTSIISSCFVSMLIIRIFRTFSVSFPIHKFLSSHQLYIIYIYIYISYIRCAKFIVKFCIWFHWGNV